MKSIKLIICLCIFFSCASTTSTTSTNETNDIKPAPELTRENQIPEATLEFGPYGKGHGSYRKIFTLGKGEIKLWFLGYKEEGKLIAANTTILDSLILSIPEQQMLGKKSYHNLTKDGSYMTLRTSAGERTIINAFQRNTLARPDTVGIDILRLIYLEGQRLLK